MKGVCMIVTGGMLLTLIACQRRAVNEQNTEKRLLQEAVTARYAQVGEKPQWYDSAGIRHNEGLNYVLDRSRASEDWSLAAVANETADFAKARFGEQVNSNLLQQQIWVLQDQKGTGIFTLAIKNMKVSEPAKEYGIQLINLVHDSTGYGELTRYLDVRDRIGAFESRIKEDRVLLESERSRLLQACSIARYSTYFWFTKDNIEHNEPPSSALPITRRLRATLTTIHDIGAFFVFSSISAAVGSSAWAGRELDQIP